MEVRPMRAQEGPRLRALRLAALADAPEAFGSDVARDAARPRRHWDDLARGPGAVLVAGDWEGIAGVIPDKRAASVWGMWVAPAARRRGAGRALLAAASEWARVRGLSELRLSVSDAAPAAEALYTRSGFTRTGASAPLRSNPAIAQHAMALALAPGPARVETERLLLRRFEPGDLEALHDIRSREDVVRWLYEDPPTLEQSAARLERLMHHVRFALTGDGLGFAAVRDGVLVGDLSLFLHSAENRQGEIGFVVHPDHQGRGYASEAAAAILELGFETFGLHRIAGTLEARNTASARVLERIGMRREAHLVENELVKGEWQSELVYARLTASRGA